MTKPTGSQIYALRHRIGMSADEFARALGFTGKRRSGTIHRYESGMRTPSDRTVRLMEKLEKMWGNT